MAKKSIRYQNAVLLVFSIAFYAWGEPVFVFCVLLSIVINYALTLLMQKVRRKKALLTLIIASNVLLLFLFKYSSFVVSNIAVLLGKDYEFNYNLPLPLGISFFTFQIMSYVFDVYYGTVKVQKNIFRMSLYVVLFPQLVAGPIVRYQTIERELAERKVTMEIFSDGVKRFIYGLSKKVLLANYMAQMADNIFEYSLNRSIGLAWIGAIAYTLQIYYDFSGYSDMAIGLGKLFGFSFPENFNYPYIAANVTDFWRRWHITLSSWFKDYVYIPLGGSRCSKYRNYLNLFVVWLMTGIWHGANWTFIAWGMFYYFILMAERVTGYCKKNTLFTRFYTIVVVIVAWVIFRAHDIGMAVTYIGQMFGVGANGVFLGCDITLKRTYLLVIIALLGVTPLLKKVWTIDICKSVSLEELWLILIFFLSVLAIVKGSYNPFIYFNF